MSYYVYSVLIAVDHLMHVIDALQDMYTNKHWWNIIVHKELKSKVNFIIFLTNIVCTFSINNKHQSNKSNLYEI